MAKQQGFTGINIFAYWFVPLTDSNEDEIATQSALDLYIGWFWNPLIFGDYPEVMKKNAGSRIPAFTAEESDIIRGSCDFLGLNYYNAYYVEDRSSTLQSENRDAVADMGFKSYRMPLSYKWTFKIVTGTTSHNYRVKNRISPSRERISEC